MCWTRHFSPDDKELIARKASWRAFYEVDQRLAIVTDTGYAEHDTKLARQRQRNAPSR